MLFQWSSPQSVVKDAVDTSPKSKSAKVLFRGQVDNVSIFCPGMSLDKIWFSNYSMYMTCWHLLGEGSLVSHRVRGARSRSRDHAAQKGFERSHQR